MKKIIIVLLGIFMFLPLEIDAMGLIVKLNDDVKYTLEVEQNDSIESVKSKVFDKSSLPVEYQTLIYNGKVLRNTDILEDYGILDNYVINLDVIGILVDEELLTSRNPSNDDGTAIYNEEDKTLTLNKYNGGIIKYYGDEELNIILKNNNIITSSEMYEDYGIYSLLGNIKVSGDGCLNIIDSFGAIYSEKEIKIDNTNIVIENALAGGFISYGKLTINGNVDIQSYMFPIMTENDVIINGGTINLVSDTMGIFVSGKGSIYFNGGTTDIKAGEKDYSAAIVIIKSDDSQGVFINDKLYIVQEGISIEEADIYFDSDDYVGYTFGNDKADIDIYEMNVESVNTANELTIKEKEKEYSYEFISVDTYKFVEGSIDKLEIKIDGNFKLFGSIIISDLKLEKDIDYIVSEGSTIINFTEEGIKKLNTLGHNEYDIIVKYNDKEVKGKLILDERVSNPSTNDKMICYMLIGIISIIGLFIVYYRKERI